MFIVLGRDVERSFETVGTKINSKKGKFYFVSKNAHSWHLNEMNDIIATVKIPSSFFFFYFVNLLCNLFLQNKLKIIKPNKSSNDEKRLEFK